MSKSLYNHLLDPNTPFYTALTGRRPKKGAYGFEVEVEGANLPGDVPGWVGHNDGSLRGESLEYVFASPFTYERGLEAINALEKAFEDNKTVLNFSYRTSIHQHINVSNLNLVHVANFITTYYILEDLLFDFAGRERAGNLFCLRAKDAQAVIWTLIRAIQSGNPGPLLMNDQIRYGALNLKALTEHGSLEVRSFRGTEDFNAIRQWYRILHELRQSVENFKDPQDVIFSMSSLGDKGFLNTIFSREIAELVSGLPNVHERLLEGARLIQDFAFGIPDWTYDAKQTSAPLNETEPAALGDMFRAAIQAREAAGRPVPRGDIQLRNRVAPGWVVADDPAHLEENEDF